MNGWGPGRWGDGQGRKHTGKKKMALSIMASWGRGNASNDVKEGRVRGERKNAPSSGGGRGRIGEGKNRAVVRGKKTKK